MAIREMWPGGPFRQYSDTPINGWIPYALGGYVNMYVCRLCQNPAPKGVYGPEWLCGPCKAQSTSKTTVNLPSTEQLDPLAQEELSI